MFSRDATLKADDETVEHFKSTLGDGKAVKTPGLVVPLFDAKISSLLEVVAVLATVAAIKLKNLCAGAEID